MGVPHPRHVHLPIGLKALVTIMRTLVREYGKTLTQHATGDVMTFILPESQSFKS